MVAAQATQLEGTRKQQRAEVAQAEAIVVRAGDFGLFLTGMRVAVGGSSADVMKKVGMGLHHTIVPTSAPYSHHGHMATQPALFLPRPTTQVEENVRRAGGTVLPAFDPACSLVIVDDLTMRIQRLPLPTHLSSPFAHPPRQEDELCMRAEGDGKVVVTSPACPAHTTHAWSLGPTPISPPPPHQEDELCVRAEGDGKVVVTARWLAHCLRHSRILPLSSVC
ncbi:unnamed protein product [Closterium sp. Naga37s-1]|nr:unnamed protein product [Closterium sp. Naga37s-1]